MKDPHANGWDVWSRHGTLLLFLATRPGSTVAQMADGLRLTQRTIRDTVADLRRAEMLRIVPNGRRLHYFVNLDASFRHPTIRDVPLRTLFGRLCRAVDSCRARAAQQRSTAGVAPAS
jgi:hypothetical protein